MKRTFAEAMAHRRSYYSIGSDSSVLDEEIVHIIREAVKNVPSAFNSQSTRIVLLLGDEHKKLWNIVKETLKARISAEAFAKTEAKIDGCFASGHGLGASLQHYNPLIDDEVRRTWNLPDDWMMIAQMPFGTPTGEPGEKEFEDLSKRIKIFL